MKIPGKIFIIFMPLLFSGFTCLAEVSSPLKDTFAVVQNGKGFSANERKQDIKVKRDRQSGKVEYNAGSREIKRLKTARPDMSKVRGARPPDIERPEGSRIPRGLGKPGGARMPGRR